MPVVASGARASDGGRGRAQRCARPPGGASPGYCNLNDLTRDDSESKVAVVLGEWEDMLQLWCVPRAALPVLLRERLLDDARNASALWRLTRFDGGTER